MVLEDHVDQLVQEHNTVEAERDRLRVGLDRNLCVQEFVHKVCCGEKFNVVNDLTTVLRFLKRAGWHNQPDISFELLNRVYIKEQVYMYIGGFWVTGKRNTLTMWEVPHELVTQAFLPQGVRVHGHFTFDIFNEPRGKGTFYFSLREYFIDSNKKPLYVKGTGNEIPEDYFVPYKNNSVLKFSLQSFFEADDATKEHKSLDDLTRVIAVAMKQTLNTPRNAMQVLYMRDPYDETILLHPDEIITHAVLYKEEPHRGVS